MSSREEQRLLLETQSLTARIAELEREVQFLRTHDTIAQGMRGESLVSALAGGELTAYRTGFDVLVGGKTKVEVKFSNLRTPVAGSPTRRWQWFKPLGERDYGKDYDLLLLLGDKDDRFANQYLDTSPYVFFLVPRAVVPDMSTIDRTNSASVISMSSNFSRQYAPKGKLLLNYLVPVQRIEALDLKVVTGT